VKLPSPMRFFNRGFGPGRMRMVSAVVSHWNLVDVLME
jgi:hypothetical protein